MRQGNRAAESTSIAGHRDTDRPDPPLPNLLRDPFLAFTAELLRRLHLAGYDDLRFSHLVVFQHIDPAGSRITELAAKAQMTKPSMGYLVRYLEQTGYVEREPDPTDGRAQLIQLTARGWQQIEDALNILADMESEVSTHLPTGGIQALRDLLHELGTATEPWHTGAPPP